MFSLTKFSHHLRIREAGHRAPREHHGGQPDGVVRAVPGRRPASDFFQRRGGGVCGRHHLGHKGSLRMLAAQQHAGSALALARSESLLREALSPEDLWRFFPPWLWRSCWDVLPSCRFCFPILCLTMFTNVRVYRLSSICLFVFL